MVITPTIRPISELKNTTGMSKLCRDVKAPIFITKNGYSDMVIMSIDTYEREIARFGLYGRQHEAETQHEEAIDILIKRLALSEESLIKGEPTVSINEARKRLEVKYNG
ncbi:MAG: type II toxin-antitoxin system Phd/YefM family antitoxin [Defluviitaleaceae bacterium]|nr:type II toxin-antitoxin system Phd/YefM family antitoxin [Defluviitaleaceae bacterium]